MSHDFEVDDQNVEQPQHDDASWATAVVAESSSSNRVWRACLECRKKKRKCDGKDTCNPCATRSTECVYPPSNDNAASSRQMMANFEAQCQHMESVCRRMETVISQFHSTVEDLNLSKRHVIDFQGIQPSSSANAIPTTAEPYTETEEGGISIRNEPTMADENVPQHTLEDAEPILDEEDQREIADFDNRLQKTLRRTAVDHIMTTDSYGKLRYVGGASTMVMIEALKSLSPAASSNHNSPQESRASGTGQTSILELPFFNRAQIWPRLSCLPRPEQLLRPPRYISDLLINLYFDQLHYTMPVVYKPHFMLRYMKLMDSSNSPDTEIDAGFLAVYFAVCACASALLPKEPGNTTTFTGIQYYENAMVLQHASTGEGSIEQVQTLALLSMCTAGWNTLAQSWKFAGQAVRAAQDLGLHRSPARGGCETLKEELCRRVWWSVYGLDRVLSICLGRPMGVEDADCDCEMPLDMSDTELEIHCQNPPNVSSEPPTGSLTGFIVFSSLCQIAGQIVRSISTLQINRLRQKPGSLGAGELLRTIRKLDKELAEWLHQVPDTIKFSANRPDLKNSHLAMCVISYMVHAGCVINLHRLLISDLIDAANPDPEDPSYKKCASAALSCIEVAELIKECVLPSHYLAFCSHYLAISGIFLLRTAPLPLSHSLNRDIKRCIQHLADLENVWTGAQRSRIILEQLLKHSKHSSKVLRKRRHSELGSSDAQEHGRPAPGVAETQIVDANHQWMTGVNELGFGGFGGFDGFNGLNAADPIYGQDVFANFF